MGIRYVARVLKLSARMKREWVYNDNNKYTDEDYILYVKGGKLMMMYRTKRIGILNVYNLISIGMLS